MTHPEGGQLTVDDVKQILFELYLAQRQVARLQAANARLIGMAGQARPEGDGEGP